MPIQLAIITAIRIDSESDLASIPNLKADLISAKLSPLDRTALHFAAEAGCLLIVNISESFIVTLTYKAEEV